MTTKIILPSADELDTGHWSETSGRTMDLYLVPAEESRSGLPEVATHYDAGGGWSQPVMAHNRRWFPIGSYGPGTIGQSVLDALRGMSAEIIEQSDRYLGAEWDGSNHRGQWQSMGSNQDPFGFPVQASWDEAKDELLRHYWTADAWFGGGWVDWPQLATEAGIDPERALGDDWQAVAAQVAEIVEPQQDELVTGTEEYALAMAERYRERAAESAEEEVE